MRASSVDQESKRITKVFNISSTEPEPKRVSAAAPFLNQEPSIKQNQIHQKLTAITDP